MLPIKIIFKDNLLIKTIESSGFKDIDKLKFTISRKNGIEVLGMDVSHTEIVYHQIYPDTITIESNSMKNDDEYWFVLSNDQIQKHLTGYNENWAMTIDNGKLVCTYQDEKVNMETIIDMMEDDGDFMNAKENLIRIDGEESKKYKLKITPLTMQTFLKRIKHPKSNVNLAFVLKRDEIGFYTQLDHYDITDPEKNSVYKKLDYKFNGETQLTISDDFVDMYLWYSLNQIEKWINFGGLYRELYLIFYKDSPIFICYKTKNEGEVISTIAPKMSFDED